jgi:hypothetical protein
MTIFANVLRNPISQLIGIYFAWIACHYIASHLYVSLCTPLTFVGFAFSSFMVAAPHCQALRWVVYNGGATIINMWGVLGAWVVSKIVL